MGVLPLREIQACGKRVLCKIGYSSAAENGVAAFSLQGDIEVEDIGEY